MFLVIQTTNSSFISSDEGSDYASLEQATAAAVEGSLRIAVDEIRAGKTASSVEAILKEPNGSQLHRVAIAVSVAPLMLPGLRIVDL